MIGLCVGTAPIEPQVSFSLAINQAGRARGAKTTKTQSGAGINHTLKI